MKSRIIVYENNLNFQLSNLGIFDDIVIVIPKGKDFPKHIENTVSNSNVTILFSNTSDFDGCLMLGLTRCIGDFIFWAKDESLIEDLLVNFSKDKVEYLYGVFDRSNILIRGFDYLFSSFFGVDPQILQIGYFVISKKVNTKFRIDGMMFNSFYLWFNANSVQATRKCVISNKNFNKNLLPRHLLQSVFKYSMRPIKIVSNLLLIGFLVNFIYLIYSIMVYYLGYVRLDGWTSITVQLNFLFSVVFLCLYFLTEFLIYVFQNRVKTKSVDEITHNRTQEILNINSNV